MRCGTVLITLLCLSAGRASAQDTTPRPPSAPADSAHDSVPPPPTPAQERYLDGLRTVARGISQLKDGIDRVGRTQSARDTVRQRSAGRRLGGLCGAARSYMANGRARMLPTAYDPPTRTVARLLTLQVDSIIAYTPTCEHTSTRTPSVVAARLTDLIRKYEAAVANWRTAVGLPNH